MSTDAIPLIAVLSGDGIGPEITAEAVKALHAVCKDGFALNLREAPVGASAYLLAGSPLPQPTLDLARRSAAVLFGAVGDPSFDHLDRSLRPERAILELRKELGLFASVKRVTVSSDLTELSPLRDSRVAGLDLLVVRELNGDVYTGLPRGIRPAPDGEFRGEREGYDTMRYARGEVVRIAHVAFKAARIRTGRVCNVDKSNVLETSRVWRETVLQVAAEYPDVTLTHMYADNAVMQLIARPTNFDVILTGNLFGDIISDAASVLTGSVGLPASALLGENAQGMFEAGHGTALDIAGQDRANPIGCIRAAALMLRYSLRQPALADRIEDAVTSALGQGFRTADIHSPGTTLVGTREMGDAIASEILRGAKPASAHVR